MNFLHPSLAIAAAASIALPIVIHLLFRRRRVPLDWAAMEILREAVRRTNRRLRMEQWIVLALRCLAVLAAGLAIAVPVLDGSMRDRSASRDWFLVIDDGATGALRAGEATEFDRLRDDARAAIAARAPGDRVGVVAASVPARVELAPTADAAAIEAAIARLSPGDAPSDLRGAFELARTWSDGDEATRGSVSGAGRPRTVVVASSFREASLPDGVSIATAQVDAGGRSGDSDGLQIVVTAPAQEPADDVRIERVDARMTPAGDAIAVRATLAREGPSLARGEMRVRASGEGLVQSEPRVVAWEQGQTDASVEFRLFPRGGDDAGRTVRQRAVELRIDDDRLLPGNAATVVVDVRPEIEVAVIGRRGSLDAADIESVPSSLWMARALAPGGVNGMRVREIDPASVDARQLVGFDAALVARPDLLPPTAVEALAGFVARGGLVAVVPAGESLSQSWSTSLFARLGVPIQAAAEAVVAAAPMRLAEEQPASDLLASLRPELAALVAPVEVTRLLRLDGVLKDSIVLALADGTPFAVASMALPPARGDGPNVRDAGAGEGRGLVVAFAASPELSWTNLPAKPLMVPLFQEVVRTGIALAAGQSGGFVGDRIRGAPGTVLRASDGEPLVIGDDGVAVEPARRSGLFRGDDGSAIAVNVRPETLRLAVRSDDSVRAALAGVGEVRIASRGERAPESAGDRSVDTLGSWPFLLLAAALALLLAEGALSRVFSHASIARAGRGDGGIVTVGRVRGAGRKPRAAQEGRHESPREEPAQGGTR